MNMRKVSVSIFMVITLIATVTGFNNAEASDYYIGKNFDGTEAYLVTDSIKEIMFT